MSYCTSTDVKNLLPALNLDTDTTAVVNGIIAQQEARLSAKYPNVSPSTNPILSTLAALRCAAIVIAALCGSGNAIGETKLSEYYDKQADGIELLLDEGKIPLIDSTTGTEYPSGFAIVTY